MKILMGTKNPGKIEGARIAFEKYFDDVEIEGISVDSEVGEEPLDKKIMQGAKNRIKNLKEYAKFNNIEADFYVASEAGLTNAFGAGDWIDFNVAVVEHKNGEQSVGVSSGFKIPDKYVDEVIEKELKVIMDRIFNSIDLNKEDGGIGKLTHGEITRIDLTKQAFIMALVKFINGDIWR